MGKRRGILNSVWGLVAKTDEQLKAGTTFSDFSARTQSGETLDTGTHRGKWLVVWFYPRASTTV